MLTIKDCERFNDFKFLVVARKYQILIPESVELIQAIFSELLSRGNVHWIDKNQTRALLCKITFPTLANSIYQWAQVSGNINQVCTFYELTSGDDTS